MKRNFEFIGFVLCFTFFSLAFCGCSVIPFSPLSFVTPENTTNSDHGSSQAMRHAQEKLNSNGYDAGAVDGVYGKNTANALKNFQRNEGLQISGKLDLATAQALGIVQSSKVDQPVQSQKTVQAKAQPQKRQSKGKGLMSRTGGFLSGFSNQLREFGKGTAFEGGTNLASDIYGGIGEGMEGSDNKSFGETVGDVNKNIVDAVKK